MGGEKTLTGEARQAIEGCGLLLGAPRLLEPYRIAKEPCLRNEEIVRGIRKSDAREIGVLVSGDPGFFSAAKKLTALLYGYEVRVVSGVSSLSYFCARLGESWDDAYVVSAHGRDGVHLARAVATHEKTFILTGGENSAAAICGRILECGLTGLPVTVGENLSYESEKITRGTPEELRGLEFDSLSVMLVENPATNAFNEMDSGDAIRKKPSASAKRAPVPRLMIAGVSSGSGKTTVTCALLAELVRRGYKTAAFKCGPDYIDPMFHSEVTGARARNLDLFLSDEETARRLLAQNAAGCDITVIEGVMGYYDGLATGTRASACHVARATGTPAVLVVDGKGMSASIAAVVTGFLRLREGNNIRGVLLNRVSAGAYLALKELIERETAVKVYGYLPVLKECGIASRHLGLVTAAEVRGLKQKLDTLARELGKTVEVDALVELAGQAPPVEYCAQEFPRLDKPVKVAIARDHAFCFYYQDNLDLLGQMGIQLVPFSPLCDTALPEGASGLLLGGGYPELYAKQLSGNAGLLAAIRQKITGGLPCVAECGGFMYLHESMEDGEGVPYPMAGVVRGRCVKTDKLNHFGYIELTAKKDGLLHKAGQAARAHEFHYWQSDAAGDGYAAQKPPRGQSRDYVHSTDTLYAGFPHLYLAADIGAAWRFARACAAYAGGKI